MPAVPHLAAPSLPAIGGIFNNPWGAVAQGLSQLPETASADTVAQQQAGQNLLDSMRKLVARNPKIANDPRFVRQVEGYGKMYGIQVPTTPQGGLDVQSFLSPGKTLQDLSPAQQQLFLSLPPGAAKSNYLRMNGVNSQLVPEGIINSPAVLSGAQRVSMKEAFGKQWLQMQKQGATPEQFLGLLNAFRPGLDDQTYSELASDPAAMSRISSDTNARLQVLHENGILLHAHSVYFQNAAQVEQSLVGVNQTKAQTLWMAAKSQALNAAAHMMASQAAVAREQTYATHSANQDSAAVVRNHILQTGQLLKAEESNYTNLRSLAQTIYNVSGSATTSYTLNIGGRQVQLTDLLSASHDRILGLKAALAEDTKRIKNSPQDSGASPLSGTGQSSGYNP